MFGDKSLGGYEKKKTKIIHRINGFLSRHWPPAQVEVGAGVGDKADQLFFPITLTD